MKYKSTEIDGVFILEPKVFNDARGYFFEAWKQNEFEEHIGKINFIQDNESKSSFGVLRGLHYQKGDFSQAKLVRVIKGRVADVAVDIRESSPTFGKYVMVELSEENKPGISFWRIAAIWMRQRKRRLTVSFSIKGKCVPLGHA